MGKMKWCGCCGSNPSCNVTIFRHMAPVSQLPLGVTGLEERVWDGFDENDQLTYTRYSIGAGEPLVHNMAGVRFAPGGINNDYRGLTPYYPSRRIDHEAFVSPYNDEYRGFVLEAAMRSGHHVKPAEAQPMRIPVRVETDNGILGGAFSEPVPTITHARVVVNDAPAGDIVTFSPVIAMKRPFAGLAGKHWEALIAALPFWPGTVVGVDDVVGVDIWFQLEDTKTPHPGSDEGNAIWALRSRTSSAVTSGIWYDPQIAGDGLYATYIGGTASAYDPAKHTFELTFSDPTRWLPGAESVWKIQDSGVDNWQDSVFQDCSIYSRQFYEPSIFREFEFTWNGERPVIHFTRVPEGESQNYDVLRVFYQPRDDGSLIDIPGGLLDYQSWQPGPFNPNGTTVFDLFAIHAFDPTGNRAVFGCRGDEGNITGGNQLANVSPSITVRRVTK